MKIIKFKYRPTDCQLEACLRLVTSGYYTDYATLADTIQYESSEYLLSIT